MNGTQLPSCLKERFYDALEQHCDFLVLHRGAKERKARSKGKNMKSQWIDTATMAAHLGVHPKTLKRLKNTTAMFEEGIDYRFAGPRRVHLCSGIWRQRNSPSLASSALILQRWRPMGIPANCDNQQLSQKRGTRS